MKRTSKNRRINLYGLSAASGLGGDRSSEMIKPDFLVFLKFSSNNFFSSEGEELMSDGEVWTEFRLEAGNLLELVDTDSKRYRVESVEELIGSSGTIHGYRGTFVRDNSFE